MNSELVRTPEAEQTVKVLEALGFKHQKYSDKHKNGALVSETFANKDGLEVTVDSTYVRRYKCDRCGRDGLVADRVTHGQYHDDKDAGRPNRFAGLFDLPSNYYDYDFSRNARILYY